MTGSRVCRVYVDKLGLFCCAALDQTLRVGFVTRLHML